MRCVDKEQQEWYIACECWMMHGLERSWIFIGGFHGLRCCSKSTKRMGNTNTVVRSIPSVFKLFQAPVDVHAAASPGNAGPPLPPRLLWKQRKGEHHWPWIILFTWDCFWQRLIGKSVSINRKQIHKYILVVFRRTIYFAWDCLALAHICRIYYISS